MNESNVSPEYQDRMEKLEAENLRFEARLLEAREAVVLQANEIKALRERAGKIHLTLLALMVKIKGEIHHAHCPAIKGGECFWECNHLRKALADSKEDSNA